jgi:hypothetical protein
MIILQAPWPKVETTTILRSPQFNDVQARQNTVDIKRAMDGTKTTYVKTTNSRYKLTYQFLISRMKALELRAFIQSYYSSKIKLVNHKREVWIVNLISNPFAFETMGGAKGWPGNEDVNITLELEGFLISSPSPPSC